MSYFQIDILAISWIDSGEGAPIMFKVANVCPFVAPPPGLRHVVESGGYRRARRFHTKWASYCLHSKIFSFFDITPIIDVLRRILRKAASPILCLCCLLNQKCSTFYRLTSSYGVLANPLHTRIFSSTSLSYSIAIR